MTWKRFAVVGCLLALLAAQHPPRANEEESQPSLTTPGTEEPKKEEPPPPPPPGTEEPKKEEPPPPPPPGTEEPKKEEPPPPPPPGTEEPKKEEPPPPPPVPEQPKKEEPPQAPAEIEKKAAPGGRRFALYVETSLGRSSFDELDSSILTAPGTSSDNKLTLDNNTHGNVTIGWLFPFDRGKVLVSWTGHKEDSYTFTAKGDRNSVRQIGSTESLPVNFLVPYWDLNATGGRLDAARTGWFWDPADDRPHGSQGPNGMPDSDEVRFGNWVDADIRCRINTGAACSVDSDCSAITPGDTCVGDGKPAPSEITFGAPNFTVFRQVPDNLQNRIQTLDLLYQRDFGGRRVSGRWTGGLRSFRYDGNVPAAAWITLGSGVEQGWTEGLLNRLLVVSQKTSGVGPTGSMQIAAHFFRRRLTIYGSGRIAFLLESLKSDTGTFHTLAPGVPFDTLYAAPARLEKKLDKSVWHAGAELGVGLEIVKGLHAEVAYNRTGYLDAVLVPTSISIPKTILEAPQGTVGLFNTHDILTNSWRVGFGYQF